MRPYVPHRVQSTQFSWPLSLMQTDIELFLPPTDGAWSECLGRSPLIWLTARTATPVSWTHWSIDRVVVLRCREASSRSEHVSTRLIRCRVRPAGVLPFRPSGTRRNMLSRDSWGRPILDVSVHDVEHDRRDTIVWLYTDGNTIRIRLRLLLAHQLHASCHRSYRECRLTVKFRQLKNKIIRQSHRNWLHSPSGYKRPL